MKGKLLLALAFIPLFSTAQNKQIHLKDLFKTTDFFPSGITGFNSMKDGRYYTQIDDSGNLVKMSFQTGEPVSVLVRAGSLAGAGGQPLSLTNYAFSRDEQKLLIRTRIHPIYRRSYTSIAFVYDLNSRKLIRVSPDPILHPTFSPDGSRVAYVLDNNLYILNLSNRQVTQVTRDGSWNHIVNGNCDWVYEEEFEFTRAFQWSPKGDYLAYYRFDESRVPEYTLPIFDSLYPTLYTYKYPVPGSKNSTIQIHVFQLSDGRDLSMDTGPDSDQYIPRIRWTRNDEVLCIDRMNRLQNRLELLAAHVNTGRTRVFYTDTDKWYIDEGLLDDIRFLPDGKRFVIMSEHDGYQHIFLYSMQGRQLALLSPGSYDVDALCGVDPVHSLVYYTAAAFSPMDRQLFVTDFSGRKTLQLTHKPGWHIIHFNSDESYYVDNYSTIRTPPVYTLHRSDGNLVRTLVGNRAFRVRLAGYTLGTPRFLKIPNSRGDTLNAFILTPPGFDPGKKYPVLFMNYGGPGSQTVTDRWGSVNIWQQYLAERGYIIFSMDNRGTGFRGEYFKKETYLHLGTMEIQDQIDAAKYLGQEFPYVDKDRIGHWGWSYGGFMSCQAITHGADVFKMAVAVAPVTSWRYYDDIYTERYMRTPAQNPEGYYETSPINFVNLIKGKFLIIHGTADDNVHFQNSAMMVKAMIDRNIPFNSAYYPNKNHGIFGGLTKLHLYTLMTRFILKNL